MLNIFILSICILLIIGGIAGTIIPYVPSVPLVFVGILIYAFYTHFAAISVSTIIIMLILTCAAEVLSYIMAIYASKYFGASKIGIYGTIAGIFVGLIFSPFGLISILICPALGTIIGEIIAGKQILESSKSGMGTLIGFFVGRFIDVMIIAWMIYVFLKAVIYIMRIYLPAIAYGIRRWQAGEYMRMPRIEIAASSDGFQPIEGPRNDIGNCNL